MDGYANCTMLIVNIIIRHREEPVALLSVDLLDATSHSIYHVEVNHTSA